MTDNEKICGYDTLRHIEKVRNYINKVVVELLKRGEQHDQTKLSSPEVELFTENTHKLASLTYNSDEYKQCLKDMKPAIDHHYANNDHHPEHWKNGINDMDLISILEMLVDWKASSENQHNGNILISIEKNCDRFNIQPQLARILENTVKRLFK